MKIKATFSDGTTLSRNTDKILTHAYQVINQWQTFTGFAGSELLAKRAVVQNSRFGTISHTEIVEIEKE
jgi:hypothetical protein